MLILVLNVFQEVDIFNKLTAKMIYVSNSTTDASRKDEKAAL